MVEPRSPAADATSPSSADSSSTEARSLSSSRTTFASGWNVLLAPASVPLRSWPRVPTAAARLSISCRVRTVVEPLSTDISWSTSTYWSACDIDRTAPDGSFWRECPGMIST